MILATEVLRPQLGPIFIGVPLAIIVLVEPVIPTLDIERFKTIERGKGFSALGLLAKANDHTKGVIIGGIIPFYLPHR